MTTGVTLNGAPISPRNQLAFEWAGEEFASGKNSLGGAVNLLKLTKVQCRAALACISLRGDGGSYTAAAFPNPSSVPGWSQDSVEVLLSEAWADHTLSSGDIMIRVSHAAPNGGAPRAEPIRVAVAPLRWPDGTKKPWGLLCLLKPLSENFDQEQCDRLAGFAARMVAYFGARQQILKEPPSLALAGDSSLDEVEETSDSPKEVEAPEAFAKNGKAKAKGQKQGVKKKRNRSTAQNESCESSGVPEELVGRVVPDAPKLYESPRTPSEPLDHFDIPDLTEKDPELGDHDRLSVHFQPAALLHVMDALGIDPVTGLEGLPMMFGSLGSALGFLRSQKGSVVLTLLNLVPETAGHTELPKELLTAVADSLRHHVRDTDQVFRLDERMFAVVTNLRSSSIYPSNIEERLAKAVRAVLGAQTVGFEVRSAVGCASGADGDLSPETLFRKTAISLESGAS